MSVRVTDMPSPWAALIAPMDTHRVVSLTPGEVRYLRSRGLSEWDLALLTELVKDFGPVKTIATRLGRPATAVRKQFQTIRDKLGAKSQADLCRILGVLSCFAEVEKRELR